MLFIFRLHAISVCCARLKRMCARAQTQTQAYYTLNSETLEESLYAQYRFY